MKSGSFVKVFAAPGIDSAPEEFGIRSSGAAFDPGTEPSQATPYDWLNEAPSQGYATEELVAGYASTRAKQANQISVRKRGVSPWGGFFRGRAAALAFQHPQGNADMNPGASRLIAGGPGQGSSMVRLHGVRNNRGMKLPVLPQEVTRGGRAPVPSGGGSHEPLTAPLIPKVPGWPSIFKVTPKVIK